MGPATTTGLLTHLDSAWGRKKGPWLPQVAPLTSFGNEQMRLTIQVRHTDQYWDHGRWLKHEPQRGSFNEHHPRETVSKEI